MPMCRFSRRVIYSGLVAGLCAVLSAGCSTQGDDPKPNGEAAFDLDPNRKISLSLAWSANLVAENFLGAKLKFAVSDQSKIEKVTISKFKPWMPTMGHGTYTEKQKIIVTPEDPAVLTVENVYFTMGGPWEIEISAVVDGQPFDTKLPVNVSATP